jgi:hypothetical protein
MFRRSNLPRLVLRKASAARNFARFEYAVVGWKDRIDVQAAEKFVTQQPNLTSVLLVETDNTTVRRFGRYWHITTILRLIERVTIEG